MVSQFFKFLFALCISGALIGPAAAEELYTVAGLHADATAASPAAAFNAALAQGRPKAWQILYRRLTRQQDWPRQPNLDATQLVKLVRGTTIANERRSTTRYVADVTYIFNPEAVSRVLQAAGIAFTQGVAKRILIVPMSPAFSTGPWEQALAAPALRDSVVPFAVAGASDAAVLTSLSFDTASWGDVAPAARRINATEAALVQAVYANGKLTVNIKRVGLNEPIARSSVDVPLLQTVGTTYPAAAVAAIHAIEDLWKSRAAVDFSQRGKLTAIVRNASLAQWGAIQSALAGVDNVTGVQVMTMDIGYGQLSIAYQGSPDQLRDALSIAGITLTNHGGEWLLAMNSSGQ